MQVQPGIWSDDGPIDYVGEEELADLPSGAARWAVFAVGMWAVIVVACGAALLH